MGGSNGLRFWSTPEPIITRFRMHAPTACIFGFPAATSRSKNPLRSGLNRIAVSVGRSSEFRSRAFPDLLNCVPPRTLDPLLNSRGDPPHAAADGADGTRDTGGSSASTVDAVGAPTPGMDPSRSAGPGAPQPKVNRPEGWRPIPPQHGDPQTTRLSFNVRGCANAIDITVD